MAHEWRVTDRTGASVIVKAGTKSGAKIAASGLGYEPHFRVEPAPDAAGRAAPYEFNLTGGDPRINRGATG